MTNPPDIQAVYDLVPKVRCKGLCGDACGPIGMTVREADALREDGIVPPRTRVHPKHGVLMCDKLTDGDRCSMYDRRPLICRVYGAVRALRCEHGCKPEGGFIDMERVVELVAMLDDGRGDYHSAPELRRQLAEHGNAIAMESQTKGPLPL